jgi:hypothetical protein
VVRLGQEAQQQQAHHAVHKVHRRRVQRVVDAQPQLQHRSGQVAEITKSLCEYFNGVQQ